MKGCYESLREEQRNVLCSREVVKFPRSTFTSSLVLKRVKQDPSRPI